MIDFEQEEETDFIQGVAYRRQAQHSRSPCRHRPRRPPCPPRFRARVRVLGSGGAKRQLEPLGSGVAEEGDELAGEVEGHDAVGGADELPADEDGGEGAVRRERAVSMSAPWGSSSSSCAV